MRFALLVLASIAIARPALAQEAEASTTSGERVALELAGGLLGAGLAVLLPARLALQNIEARDAHARHCAMELTDCGVWSIEFGPFVGPTLLYGLIAPLTTAAGVALAGHSAGGFSRFGVALAGAAIGMVPAAVLTLAAAYGSDEAAFAALIAGGTLLPTLISVLFYEVDHNAIQRRKRATAFSWQPFATLAGDNRGVLLGASGTF
jgi:hypothetical protein